MATASRAALAAFGCDVVPISDVLEIATPALGAPNPLVRAAALKWLRAACGCAASASIAKQVELHAALRVDLLITPHYPSSDRQSHLDHFII